jgi:DNA-binding MarR family transcriptional regulator
MTQNNKEVKLQISISSFQLDDKLPTGDSRWRPFTASFTNRAVTLQQLLDAICDGHAWSSQFTKRWRARANFKQTNVMALDFDHGVTLQDVLSQPHIQQYAAAWYYTINHKPEHPRFRILFVLDKTILSASELQDAYRALLALYPDADPSPKDAGRFFYGAQATQYGILGHILPIEQLRTVQAHVADPTPTPEPRGEGQTTANAVSWLVYAHRLVAEAREGERNNILNKVSYTIGGLVAGGYVSEQMARDTLHDAALACKLEEREILATLQSGLRAGMAQPLHPRPAQGGSDTPTLARIDNLFTHLRYHKPIKNNAATKVLTALLALARQYGSDNVTVGVRTLRRHANLGSTQTVQAALDRLQKGDWLRKRINEHGANTYILNLTRRENMNVPDEERATALAVAHTYAQHMGDDAFAVGASKTARRLAKTMKVKWKDVPTGLGDSFLHIACWLHHAGPMNRAELVERTGLTYKTVQRHTTRGEELGLFCVTVGPRGKKTYGLDIRLDTGDTSLPTLLLGTTVSNVSNVEDEDEDDGLWHAVPDIWERIKALEPTLRTYKIGAERHKRDVIHELSYLKENEPKMRTRWDYEEWAKYCSQVEAVYLELLLELEPNLTVDEANIVVRLPLPSPSWSAKVKAIDERNRQQDRERYRERLRREEEKLRERRRHARSELMGMGLPKNEWGHYLKLAGYTGVEVGAIMSGGDNGQEHEESITRRRVLAAAGSEL